MRFTQVGKILENILIVIFIIVIGVLAKSFYDNYRNYLELSQMREKVDKEIVKENNEIKKLKKNIDTTNSTIEQKARSQYYMLRDNETVIIFKK